MAKLSKNENLTTDVLLRICDALKCDISDIMEVSLDDEDQSGSDEDEKV